MLLQTFAWQKESGWSAPLPAGMDSEATLAVMFGGNPVDDCGAAIAEVAGRLPNSVLLGCSTAGEIFGARVQDVSLSLAVARFAPERRVTAARGNVLYELDGKPALALYKDYLGERAAGLPATATAVSAFDPARRRRCQSVDPHHPGRG